MNWHDFHFIRPFWLLALIPLLVIFTLFIKRRFSYGQWTNVCDEELLPFILESVPVTHTRWMLGALTLAATLSILALAGPTWERLESPTFTSSAALVIVLDLSPTMNTTDIKPSRLVRARFKIADILRQRKDGLTALVVYSGDAFTVTPLTNDKATIENQLNVLDSNIMPAAGKNTAAAVKQAIQLLKQAGQQQGDILLITDGIDNDNLHEISDITHYKISILGVGTSDGGPVKLSSGGFLKDQKGNIVLPRLQPSVLANVAHKAGGIYTGITTDDKDVGRLLSFFDRTVNSRPGKKSGLAEQWNDLGPWLILMVLPLAALSFRQGFLIVLIALLLPIPNTSYAFGWDDVWLTKDQQAQQAFQNKQYDKATKIFQSPDWRAASAYKAGDYQQALEALKGNKSADGLYNKGNALAKLGDYDKAIEAYEQALKLNPDNDDAKHNLRVLKDAKRQQNQNKKQNQNQNQNKGKDQQKQDKGNKQQHTDSQDENSSDNKQHADNNERQDGENESPQAKEGKSEQPQDDNEKGQDKQSEVNQPKSKQGDASEEETDKKSALKETTEPLSDEKKQAAEQWLNRIEDDPAGLLKRKFKYQYRHRQYRQ